MIDFLLFALRRYARFGSYAAAFLAGLGCVVSGAYFWIPLAAVILGSLCSYLGRSRPRAHEDAPRARSAETVSATPAPDPVVAALIQQVLNSANGGGENNA